MHEIVSFSSINIYKSQIELADFELDKLDDIEYIAYNSDNGAHSKNHYILSEPRFAGLSQAIQAEVATYVNDILKITDDVRFKITTSWLSKHETGDYAHSHHHKNSIFSGIVYINTPEKSGNIFFARRNENLPEFLKLDFSEINKFNCDTCYFVPKRGDIFIFPSSLNHYTGVNESTDMRLCLSFNLFPLGKLSDGIRELIIN